MKKTISIILSAVLAVSALAACSDEKSVSSEIVSINGFGSYDEAGKVKYQCFVGSVDLLENGEELSGKSIRLEIERSRQPNWAATENILYSPRLIFQAKEDSLGYDLTDITSVSSFGVDVYNANDYDAVLLFWAQGTGGIVYDTYAELPAKTRTSAVFAVNPLFAQNGGERCETFTLAIVDNRINDPSFKKYYYFGNFRAVREGTAPGAEMDKLCGDYEALSFDEESDIKYVTGHHIDGQYGAVSIPAGGAEYKSVTPIGGAMNLRAFGNNPYESYDLSYHDEDMQKYGVKLADELVKDLDFTKLDGGWALTANVYNPDPRQTRGVYLVVEDASGARAQNKLTLSPMSGGKLELKNTFGLNLKNVTGLYIMYDTYNLFRPADLYVNHIGFEREAGR